MSTDLIEIAKRAGERDPHVRAKARAVLPGEGWREESSKGAQLAHDKVLPAYRERAKEEGWRERAHAARSIESKRYRIRVRGYDRKYGKYGPSHEEASKSLVEIGKSFDAFDAGLAQMRGTAELDEVAKFFGAVRGLAGRVGGAAKRGFSEAAEGGKNVFDSGLAAYGAGAKEFGEAGGLKSARQAAMSDADDLASSGWRPTKKQAAIGAGAAGGAALLAGGAMAGRHLYRRAGRRISNAKIGAADKAKKYALYGGAGLAGTVALGTAAGNTVSR